MNEHKDLRERSSIAVISQFDKKVLGRFCKYLNSDFFPIGYAPEKIAIIQWLRKNRKDKVFRFIDLHGAASFESGFAESTFNRILSELRAEFLQFLSVSDFMDAQPVVAPQALERLSLESVKEADIMRIYEKARARVAAKPKTIPDVEGLKQLFDLDNAVYGVILQDNFKDRLEFMRMLEERLHVYHHAQTASLICARLNQLVIHGHKIDVPAWQQKLHLIDHSGSEITVGYFLVARVMLQPDETASLGKFREWYQGVAQRLSEKSACEFRDYLVNLYIRRHNSGVEGASQDLLSIYKLFGTAGLRTRGKILGPHLLNFATFHIRAGDLQAVEDAIAKCVKERWIDHRNSYVLYARAMVAFARENWDDAMALAEKVANRRVENDRLRANSMFICLRSLYLRWRLAGKPKFWDDVAFARMYDRIKQFIRRKFSNDFEQKYQQYLTSLQFTKLLARLTHEARSTDAEWIVELRALRSEVESAFPLADKAWLLRMIDRLLGEA